MSKSKSGGVPLPQVLPSLRRKDQGDAMNAPIPVADALRLIEMALDQEFWTSAEPWQLSWAMSKMAEQDAHFVVLARATMRPMLEHAKEHIGPWKDGIVHPRDSDYPPIAALMAHYDATRPGWRDSK